MNEKKLEQLSFCYNVFKWFITIGYLLFLFTALPPYLELVFVFIDTAAFFFFSAASRKEFVFYRIRIIEFATFMPAYICNWFSTRIPVIVPFMFGLIMIIIFSFLLFSDNDKKGKKVAEIGEKLKIKSRGQKEDNYSIKICDDEETNKPVIQDSDSRYVHTLIVGPTGCGKTSTAIIPMIWQDVIKDHGFTVIEPKGDLAERVYAMCIYTGKPVLYFNPIMPDCPSFNPLDGPEDEVIETLTTVFEMLTPDSKTYFKDIANNLVRKSLMVLKRLEAAYTDPKTGISSRPATLIELSDLIHNTGGKGREMVQELITLPCIDPSEQKQNIDTSDWFLNDYFSDKSKIYENSSGVRTQVANLIQNKYLRKILNPANGKSDINFDEHLANGGRIVMTTAQGALRELSSYLGYFIIFTLQSSIFRRPGNEDTRVPNFLYIDEAQKYLNPGFCDILTQGRSYRVSAILATQSRGALTMNAGSEAKSFLNTIDTNCRNLVIFPGVSAEDAKFYSDTFGEIKTIQERRGESSQKFSLAMGFKSMNYPTESHQYQEVTEAEHSTTDIVYKGFNSITYRLVANKEVQRARVGIVKWIDKDINTRLTEIINNYNDQQQRKRDIAQAEIAKQREEIYSNFRHKKMQAGKEPFSDREKTQGKSSSTKSNAKPYKARNK